MHPTTAKGDIGVAITTADLISQEAKVLMPVSHTSPYDLVIHYHDKYYRVQVKYRTVYKGKVEVKPKRAVSRFSYEKNTEFDILAIYCPEINKVAYIHADDFTNVVTLRVEPSKNNQSIGVKPFEDYTELNKAIHGPAHNSKTHQGTSNNSQAHR